MNRGIRDIGIIGPTGPKGPTYCPYCRGRKPLMEEGEPRDDDYNCVWIDKQRWSLNNRYGLVEIEPRFLSLEANNV